MKITQTELQSKLEAALKKHKVPGASVAVFSGGDLVAATAGVINTTTGVEVTPDTVMHIGSITKIFNSTLMMQLVDEGKVDLEAPVLRYLPELKIADMKALEQISVKMLLNHTSGIDGEWLPLEDHDEETIEKAVGRFAKLGQLFPPKTECSYCNTATVIAGYLMQRLTGKSWYRLVRERIFEPLGMAHAVALPEDALLHRASVGHFLNPADNSFTRTSFAFLSLSFAPAGSTLMTSATDLITFARMHMAGGVGPNGKRIISEKSVKAMQQMTVDNRGKGYTPSEGVGIGWMLAGDGVLNHSGGGPGIVASLYADPKRQFAVATLTNASHGSNLINDLVAPWLKETANIRPVGVPDVEIPATPIKVDVERFVGSYQDVVNRYIVTKNGDGLAVAQQPRFGLYDDAKLEAGPAAPLVALANGHFVLGDGANARIVAFRNPDANGRMQHMGTGLRLYKRVS